MSWDLKLVNTNRIHLITTDVQKIKQDFQNQNIKIKKKSVFIFYADQSFRKKMAL